jgi:hypothetical protein
MDLPSGWVRKISSSGRPYYVNYTNGVTTWHPPPGSKPFPGELPEWHHQYRPVIESGFRPTPPPANQIVPLVRELPRWYHDPVHYPAGRHEDLKPTTSHPHRPRPPPQPMEAEEAAGRGRSDAPLCRRDPPPAPTRLRAHTVPSAGVRLPPPTDTCAYVCDACLQPIESLRWHCSLCVDTDLCNTCYQASVGGGRAGGGRGGGAGGGCEAEAGGEGACVSSPNEGAVASGAWADSTCARELHTFIPLLIYS